MSAFPEISFVDEVAHFLQILGWTQETILREEGLRPLHLAFMRCAARWSWVSYNRMAAETEMPKEEISRAGGFLVTSGLANVRKDPRDGRRRHLFLTERGERKLKHIQVTFEKRVQEKLKATSHESKRLYKFTMFLWNANRFLPYSWVANPDTFFEATISAEETVELDWPRIREIKNDLDPPRPPKSNHWRPPTEW